MSSKQSRIDLRIDVLDEEDQHALVLATLKPSDLVNAILAEFHNDVDYLGDDPAGYRLVRAGDGAALDSETSIGQQAADGDRLALQEVGAGIPADSRPLSKKVYLREMATGRVFRLGWQPAIVGRSSEDQPKNEWVAVDLQAYPTGLRVSRRQVSITEKDGQLFVENLSKNPASIRRGENVVVPIEAHQQPILPGDVIDLERSEIMLKLIVRNGAARKPGPASAAMPPVAPEDEQEKEN